MPPQKEVHSLKELSMKGVGKYLECASRELMAIVCEISKRDQDLGVSFLKTSIAHLSKHLFESVSRDLVQDIVQYILQLLPSLLYETRDTYMKCFCMETHAIRIRTAVLLTNILLHPNVQAIDISSLPKIMKHVILNDLHKMSGVKQLDLGAGSCGWEISETEQYVLKGLTCMSNLAQLHLSIDCTDAIVRCISLHCKRLQVLNIPNSRSVTERCIPHLTQLKELRQVFLNHTSVTEEGYTSLLNDLPGLRNMGWCHYIAGVMEALKHRGTPLQLTHLECDKVPEETLHTIVTLCPSLLNLTLHDVHETDLTCLQRLQHLKSLALTNGNITSMRLLPYLSSYGNLQCLYLKGVHNLDEACLMQLSDACPNLSTLGLDTCECTARHTPPHNKARYFSNLQTLTCYTVCPTEHLDILLKGCHDIRSIVMGNSTIPNDAYILHILQHNPMTELTELKIAHSHTLSMRSVRALVKQCTNLRVLAELSTWYLISDSEYIALQEEIEANNMNLTTRTVFLK